MITNIELAKTFNNERDRHLAERHHLVGANAVAHHLTRRALGRRLEQFGKRLQGPEIPRPGRSNA